MKVKRLPNLHGKWRRRFTFVPRYCGDIERYVFLGYVWMSSWYEHGEYYKYEACKEMPKDVEFADVASVALSNRLRLGYTMVFVGYIGLQSMFIFWWLS